MISKSFRIIGIWVFIVVLCSIFFVVSPPIAQDLCYHNFADQRGWFSVPHFANVISNLPYLVIGLMGLWRVGLYRRLKLEKQENSEINVPQKSALTIAIPQERRFWFIFFIGVFFVGVGSGYYHLHPTNVTLVWDRLPMTISFMSLFAYVIFDRLSVKQGLTLLPIFLIFGVLSVLYWAYTESIGMGDLRPYAIVQFGPMIFILLMFVFFDSHYTGGKYFVWVFIWYALAKIFEYFDNGIYQVSQHMVGGHALKHLAAGIACYEVVRYLRARRYRN